MELTNMLLMILVAIVFVITILFVLNIRERINRKIDINNIKFYLEEYLKEFNTSEILELYTKVKINNNTPTTIKNPFLRFLIAILITVPICVLRLIVPNFVKSLNDIILIAGIGIIFIVFALIIFFLTKSATTKKIILRNNIIELNDNNNETKIYQLATCNIKYNLQTIGTFKQHRYINIYFNNDKFTSKEYNIYDFELYIAFIIFINLLKTDDIEKIKSLTNNDIEKLKQNYIYNEENLSRVGE